MDEHPSNTALQSDEDLAELAKNGDKTALDFVINKYKPLAVLATGEFYIYGADKEDLIQEGMIGLYNAVMSFDRSKQSRFYFFAKLCVRRQIITAVKGAARRKHSPLNARCVTHNLGEIEKSPEDIVISREERAALEVIMTTRLSIFENKVLNLHLKGCCYTEIAARLGCSIKSVDNARQRIKRKLK